MNILYYGNCQLFAVKTLLNLQNFNETNIECFNTNIDEREFTNIIMKQNIIITQPIQDNYRDKNYLSTNYVINHCKDNCKIIIFDSCHFNFYYCDLTYQLFNNKLLHEPIDYHYHGMIECYKKGLSINHYIEKYVNNVNLKSNEELENMAEKSLNELNKRYNENIEKYKNNDHIFIISTYEFIKKNYKDKLLFYSMNHPTKYVIQYICEEIIKILNIKNTILYNKDVLNNPRPIIYKCIQKVVKFNIDEYTPFTCGKTNINDLTQLYYDTYKRINF